MLGPEPIMDEIRTLLRAGLATQIAAINAAHSDIVLPDIPDEAIHLETYDGRNFFVPAITIAESSFTAGPQNSAFLEATYVVGIDVWDKAIADGLEAMHRRLWRYQKAVIDTLMDHKSETGYWAELYFANRRPSPLLQEVKTREYYRAKGITLGILVPEDMT
jgi:hypothetical protein